MWLTAAEALRMLGVRPQTLYANVSRKRIRAKADPKDTRRSLYHEADVQKLAHQQGGRRKATVVAAGAIEWGEPILPSAVSTVVAGRLYYRGKDAAVLSQTAALEEVAAMLWGAEAIDFDRPTGGGEPAARGTLAPNGSITKTKSSRAMRDAPLPFSGLPLQRAFVALGNRASVDLSTYGRSPSVLRAEAAGVLTTLVDSMLEPAPAGGRSTHGTSGRRASMLHARSEPIHDRIAASLGRRRAADTIRRALVLLADHELNASTFATRVAVSTGAPLAAGVLSGLATLSGPLHGRAALGVLELVAAVEKVGAERAVRDWLSQGRPIAGFGHTFYPAGDPRAVALLGQLTLPPEYAGLRDVVEEVIGERPNVDFSLAALAKVHRLPPEAPLILFALGRCVGWLAHALEQVTTGQPIRPRARYVGPPIS